MIDPVLIDVPSTLETDRLVLRAPQAGDGPVLFAAVSESLPELRRFLASLPWVATEQTLESSEVYCRTAGINFLARRDLPYLLFHKASGELVGVAGLHRPVWQTPKLEIGYWGRTSTSGRGFVSEAVEALAALAFDRFRAVRIELCTDEENSGSRRVAQRCGFQLEGILRRERRGEDGSLRNMCIYARLAPGS